MTRTKDAPAPGAAPARPILVGAFEPFGGRRRNRAWEAARLLEGARLFGHALSVIQLPTVFAALPGALDRLYAQDPDVVLLVGESAAARWLLVERLAVNVAHARLADNAGARPIDEEVEPGGEPARRVSFDPRAAVRAALEVGVRCDVSSHAGTFCCNASLYLALGRAARRSPPPPTAFVHVPARFPWARNARAARGLTAIARELLRATLAANHAPAGSAVAIGSHCH